MPQRTITVVLTECTDTGDGPPMWVVSSPDLPGLNTQSRKVANALEMAGDAVRELGLDRTAGQEEAKP